MNSFTPPRVMPPLSNIFCEATILPSVTFFMSQFSLLTVEIAQPIMTQRTKGRYLSEDGKHRKVKIMNRAT